MPGYNAHRLFNYTIFAGIIIFLFFRNFSEYDLVSLFAAGLGYYIGTEYVTPDLDTNSTAFKRWGRLKALLLPYKWLFNHRKSSHNIFYGAIVRILYIGIVIFGLYYLIFRSIPYEMAFPSSHIINFFVGIIAANALHVILDGF